MRKGRKTHMKCCRHVTGVYIGHVHVWLACAVYHYRVGGVTQMWRKCCPARNCGIHVTRPRLAGAPSVGSRQLDNGGSVLIERRACPREHDHTWRHVGKDWS
jgi:hypothetical protein